MLFVCILESTTCHAHHPAASLFPHSPLPPSALHLSHPPSLPLPSCLAASRRHLPTKRICCCLCGDVGVRLQYKHSVKLTDIWYMKYEKKTTKRICCCSCGDVGVRPQYKHSHTNIPSSRLIFGICNTKRSLCAAEIPEP
jgi:hypothetical protein